jgi:phosphoserine phosphatase RsbU/P
MAGTARNPSRAIARSPAVQPGAQPGAVLVVVDPNGRKARVPVSNLPFRMGRAPDSDLVLRDSRVSRNHARITQADGQYILEDLGSRHGVFADGKRIERTLALAGGESIGFGVPDGYRLHFTRPGDELGQLMARATHISTGDTGKPGGPLLEKLRAVLEVARSLQSSFSADDVLNTVLDVALAATGAERGFLLLFDAKHELQVRRARARDAGDKPGRDLPPDDLRIPRGLIQQALESRRDLFAMSFDPAEISARAPGNTIGLLELRSVACIPLVRGKPTGSGATELLANVRASAGLLYLDSRAGTMDLAGGNHELLQTLAIDASSVLENARLIEEERERQRIEEELDLARRIQRSLMPRKLPDAGWFVVHGTSESSHQVGGDYFDVLAVGPDTWSMVIADVSGKGVSSALVASFLQGAFMSASMATDIGDMLSRINTFLSDRAEHGKYATMFYSRLNDRGVLTYSNAGHCPPLLVRKNGGIEKLEATAVPVGLVPDTHFALSTRQLEPGDRIVFYTDGVTEAQNEAGDFFGRRRLIAAIRNAEQAQCRDLHEALRAAILEFTSGAEQADDVTLVVMEYRR